MAQQQCHAESHLERWKWDGKNAGVKAEGEYQLGLAFPVIPNFNSPLMRIGNCIHDRLA
jgi:hypothetical protein